MVRISGLLPCGARVLPDVVYDRLLWEFPAGREGEIK